MDPDTVLYMLTDICLQQKCFPRSFSSIVSNVFILNVATATKRF